MKHKILIPAALALVLVLGMSIGGAMAYFTTYATAAGGLSISLPGSVTEVEEGFSSWQKRVTVSNDEGSAPVFVRARAFSGDAYALTYSGENWAPNADGYYYYSPALAGGQTTEALLVNIDNIPEDAAAGDNFNVIVVYETTPVLYDADGAEIADWSITIDGGGN